MMAFFCIWLVSEGTNESLSSVFWAVLSGVWKELSPLDEWGNLPLNCRSLPKKKGK